MKGRVYVIDGLCSTIYGLAKDQYLEINRDKNGRVDFFVNQVDSQGDVVETVDGDFIPEGGAVTVIVDPHGIYGEVVCDA